MGYYRIHSHLRFKPSSRPSPALHIDPANSSVHVDMKHAGGGPPRHHSDQLVFHYDSIIQNTSQEAIFDQCALKVVEDVLTGYNGTILAYGQSGSGKTFSMSGDLKNHAHRGIIPRSLHRIFVEKELKPEAEISIHVSYIEVYNDVIYDLLGGRQGSASVVMAMEENGFIDLKGLCLFACDTEEQALKLFSKGERRRSTAANTLNKASNRSHCMFTIYVERHTKMREVPERTAAKLNLVDLAGCERLKGMEAPGQFEKETMNINKSLTFLEQAVSELRKGQVHVSFRQSRLTLLLRDALGGNSKTSLIVCALQEHEFLDETISSLRFSQRVKDLKTSAVVNKVFDPIYAERRYERKIADLKQELALYDALSGRIGIAHDDLTEQKKIEIRKKIQEFISGKADVDTIPVENLTQVKETFTLFKEIALHFQMENLLDEIQGTPKIQKEEVLSTVEDEDGVGELEGQGFHVGVAPPNARPEQFDVVPSNIDKGITKMTDVTSLKQTHFTSNLWEGDHENKNKEFIEFKHNTLEGLQHDSVLKRKRSELKEKKKLAQKLSDEITETRKEIQYLKRLFGTKRDIGENDHNQMMEEENIADADDKNLLERLNFAKATYGKDFTDFKKIKEEIGIIQKELKDCQQSLLESFFIWYDTNHMNQLKT